MKGIFCRAGVVILIAALMFTAFPTLPASAGVTRYAAPSAVGSGNCSSWANACTLQTALTGAASGDEIWVKVGAHYPGSALTDTFSLKNGVVLYGGFNGTETMLSQRNWTVNKTILSGDIDHNDTNTDSNFIAETWNDIQGSNSYHVITGSGTDNTAVLDGFIITAGQADGSYPHDSGGGMYNYNGSPTLTNVTFSGNMAEIIGGGMENYSNSSPTLTNVTFSGNMGNLIGGGMYNYSSSPTLTNVTFSGNSAGDGGGMYNYSYSSPTLMNVTFSGNSADNGGGMYNYSYSSPTLTNVTFSGNQSYYGGGMYNYSHSSPTLTNVTFSGNAASDNGGGMVNFDSSNPTLTNVTFSGNTASASGGGMINYDFCSPTLTNVTFSDNTASASGGGMINEDSSSPTLTNVIFSGNQATSYYGGGMANDDYSSPTLTNVTFSGNTAYYGGGMYNYVSSPTLTNITFSGNQANYGDGMYNYDSSSPTLKNVIIWGSTHGSIYNDSSTPNIFNSDIQGCGVSGIWNIGCGTDGGGNIDANPLFVDADGADNIPGTLDDNLRLMPNSLAIDRGTNSGCPTKDLDGLPRPADGNRDGIATCDMGAYEAQIKWLFLPLILKNAP